MRGVGGLTVSFEEGYHTPIEEYLETIHALAEEGVPVIQARVAERLGRSAPSVSEMLGRLEAEGYVAREGRSIVLTRRGEQLATKVVRRHRLAERLLVEVIGLEWHKVHREAGRWEHVISDDVEEKLVALLGDPGSCPHGNPIPGSANTTSTATHRPVTEAEPGEEVAIVRIGEEVEHDDVAMEAIAAAGLTPGALVSVVSCDRDRVVLATPSGEAELAAAVAEGLYFDGAKA